MPRGTQEVLRLKMVSQVFPCIVFASLIFEISAPLPSLFNFPFSWDEPEYVRPQNGWDTKHQGFKEDFKATKLELSKKAFKNKMAMWPKAAVIYKVDDNVGCPYSNRCHMLMNAMSHYEKRGTCIRFKEWSGEDDYVVVFVHQDRDICWSTIGRIGGEQRVSLGETCWLEGLVIHELGHAVGFWDEHNRPDRDRWVHIFFRNISPDMRHAFTKADPAIVNLLEEPFDYKSIMMYDNYSFSKDGMSPTLQATNNEPLLPIWKKGQLSDTDVRKINKLYRCSSTGGKQKPRFPTDISCSFDEDTCGFKGINQQNWSWSPAKSLGVFSFRSGGKGGELYSDFDDAGNTVWRVWSINFHGLSPIDKDRGPMGCVSFSYAISADGQVNIKLFQMMLDNPQQLFYDPKRAIELWSQSQPTDNDGWFRALITIRVTDPFLLTFQSEFGPGTTYGTIKLDNLELSYSPCPNKRSYEPKPAAKEPKGKPQQNSLLGSWLGSLI